MPKENTKSQSLQCSVNSIVVKVKVVTGEAAAAAAVKLDINLVEKFPFVTCNH